ncbi:hypothetical protein QTN25_005499 [Entamoeba marina]
MNPLFTPSTFTSLNVNDINFLLQNKNQLRSLLLQYYQYSFDDNDYVDTDGFWKIMTFILNNLLNINIQTLQDNIIILTDYLLLLNPSVNSIISNFHVRYLTIISSKIDFMIDFFKTNILIDANTTQNYIFCVENLIILISELSIHSIRNDLIKTFSYENIVILYQCLLICNLQVITDIHYCSFITSQSFQNTISNKQLIIQLLFKGVQTLQNNPINTLNYLLNICSSDDYLQLFQNIEKTPITYYLEYILNKQLLYNEEDMKRYLQPLENCSNIFKQTEVEILTNILSTTTDLGIKQSTLEYPTLFLINRIQSNDINSNQTWLNFLITKLPIELLPYCEGLLLNGIDSFEYINKLYEGLITMDLTEIEKTKIFKVYYTYETVNERFIQFLINYCQPLSNYGLILCTILQEIQFPDNIYQLFHQHVCNLIEQDDIKNKKTIESYFYLLFSKPHSPKLYELLFTTLKYINSFNQFNTSSIYIILARAQNKLPLNYYQEFINQTIPTDRVIKKYYFTSLLNWCSNYETNNIVLDYLYGDQQFILTLYLYIANNNYSDLLINKLFNSCLQTNTPQTLQILLLIFPTFILNNSLLSQLPNIIISTTNDSIQNTISQTKQPNSNSTNSCQPIFYIPNNFPSFIVDFPYKIIPNVTQTISLQIQQLQLLFQYLSTSINSIKLGLLLMLQPISLIQDDLCSNTLLINTYNILYSIINNEQTTMYSNVHPSLIRGLFQNKYITYIEPQHYHLVSDLFTDRLITSLKNSHCYNDYINLSKELPFGYNETTLLDYCINNSTTYTPLLYDFTTKYLQTNTPLNFYSFYHQFFTKVFQKHSNLTLLKQKILLCTKSIFSNLLHYEDNILKESLGLILNILRNIHQQEQTICEIYENEDLKGLIAAILSIKNDLPYKDSTREIMLEILEKIFGIVPLRHEFIHTEIIQILNELMNNINIEKVNTIIQTKSMEGNPSDVMAFSGLKNLGSTCYVNSIIQALYTQTKFKELMLQESLTLSNLFKEMELKQTVNMEPYIQLLTNSRIDLNRQDDAAIFFNDIITFTSESLHKNLPFTLSLNHIRKCSCGFQQESSQTDISLTVESQSTLQESLKNHFQPSIISDVFCPQCGIKKQFTEVVELQEVNESIVIKINRVMYTDEASKINDNVSFPMILDNQYIPNITDTYHLTSIILHRGTAHSGHYTTLSKTETNKWYLFNDAIVTEYDIDLNLHTIQNQVSMLFYTKQTPTLQPLTIEDESVSFYQTIIRQKKLMRFLFKFPLSNDFLYNSYISLYPTEIQTLQYPQDSPTLINTILSKESTTLILTNTVIRQLSNKQTSLDTLLYLIKGASSEQLLRYTYALVNYVSINLQKIHIQCIESQFTEACDLLKNCFEQFSTIPSLKSLTTTTTIFIEETISTFSKQFGDPTMFYKFTYMVIPHLDPNPSFFLCSKMFTYQNFSSIQTHHFHDDFLNAFSLLRDSFSSENFSQMLLDLMTFVSTNSSNDFLLQFGIVLTSQTYTLEEYSLLEDYFNQFLQTNSHNSFLVTLKRNFTKSKNDNS